MNDQDQLQELIKQNQHLSHELQKLSKHLVQTIIRLDENIPLDRMAQFTEILKKPLSIDDRRTLEALKRFDSQIQELSQLNVIKILSEINYIGNRLNEIEELLKHFHAEGIVHNVSLDFRMDGHKLVKKPVSFDPSETIEEPYAEYNKVLNILDEAEKSIVMRYLGLCGHEKETFVKIAKSLNKSTYTVSQSFHSAIRQLRQEKIAKSVENLPVCDLKHRIIGRNPFRELKRRLKNF